MTGLLLVGAGLFGVVIFAFLSWRELGGSMRQPDANDLAASAPPLYRWCGRASALVAVIGIVRLLTS
jgi:hypothetical protein